jgi:serine/threonine-protein kinase RsbW
MEDDTIVMAVEDEGNGFDRGGVPDPLSAENLLRDSGRGLFIIEQLADDVSYLNDGRKLVLRFDASSTSDPTEA